MPEKRTRKRTTDVTNEEREDEEAKTSLLLQWRSFFEEKNHHHRRRKRCGLHPYWEEKEWKPLRIKSSEEEEEEQLPSREEIISQFGLFGGSKDSSENNNERQHCEIDFTTGTCANGEKCERCERWKRFVDGVGGDAAKKKKKHYEVFTRDLVRGVVQHVKERCVEKEIGKTRVVVLELGARDGTFARAFVREWTDERTRLEYFACDSTPKDASVTKRDASEAIREIGKKYEGRDSDTLCIALVSWMPFQIDWTREIRKHAAFDEYILIGEGEGGICGSKETFGQEDEGDDQSDGDEKEGEEGDVPALYEREGFVMRELEKVKNLGKSDTTYEREGTHSKTISFRRRVDIQ